MGTPYGIRAHLPCLDVGVGTDSVLVDIFCRSTHRKALGDNRIYLLLRKSNATANEDLEGYSCYDCQWLEVRPKYFNYTFGTRILHVTEANITPGKHGSSPAHWRDIYISARPRHRADLKSDVSELVARLAANAPNFPSLRIQPHLISNDDYYCCATTPLPPESHPWMGHPPFNLAIKNVIYPSNPYIAMMGKYTVVLTLGVCEEVNKGIAVASNHTKNASQYYAILKTIEKKEAEDEILKVSSGTYETPQHDCRKDHVSDGSTISRRIGVSLLFRIKISFRRSLLDVPGNTLEVHSVSRQYPVSRGEYDRGLTFQ